MSITAAGGVVTVNPVVTPTMTPTRSAMPPIAAVQPINPLNTTVNTLPQLRLDVADSELVISQQAMQPLLAVELAQHAPNLPSNLGITPSVSVSMNTSMDIIAPPQGSIAPMSMVDTLPLPTVSLSQQTSMAAMMCQTANTATLLSYPIMSHSPLLKYNLAPQTLDRVPGMCDTCQVQSNNVTVAVQEPGVNC